MVFFGPIKFLLRNCIFVYSGRMSHTPQTARSTSSLSLVVFIEMVQCHRTEIAKCIKSLLSTSHRLTAEYKWHHTTIAFQFFSPFCLFEDILKMKRLFRLPMSRFKNFLLSLKSVGTQDGPANQQNKINLLCSISIFKILPKSFMSPQNDQSS